MQRRYLEDQVEKERPIGPQLRLEIEELRQQYELIKAGKMGELKKLQQNCEAM